MKKSSNKMKQTNHAVDAGEFAGRIVVALLDNLLHDLHVQVRTEINHSELLKRLNSTTATNLLTA